MSVTFLTADGLEASRIDDFHAGVIFFNIGQAECTMG